MNGIVPSRKDDESETDYIKRKELAFGLWQGDALVMTAALGHAEETALPLLRTSARASITQDSGVVSTAAADALGRQAAAQLRALGADAYLAAAPGA